MDCAFAAHVPDNLHVIRRIGKRGSVASHPEAAGLSDVRIHDPVDPGQEARQPDARREPRIERCNDQAREERAFDAIKIAGRPGGNIRLD